MSGADLVAHAGVGREETPGPGPGGGGAGSGGRGTGSGPAASGAGPGGGGTGGAGGDLLAAIHARLMTARAYPYAARVRGAEGTATVRFRIGRHGAVERVDLVGTSGDRALDEAALRAVRRAAPFPAEEMTITVPIVFDLDEATAWAR